MMFIFRLGKRAVNTISVCTVQCIYKNEKENKEQIPPSRVCVLPHKTPVYLIVCINYCMTTKV